MASEQISDLPAAITVNSTDLIAVQQSDGVLRKATAGKTQTGAIPAGTPNALLTQSGTPGIVGVLSATVGQIPVAQNNGSFLAVTPNTPNAPITQDANGRLSGQTIGPNLGFANLAAFVAYTGALTDKQFVTIGCVTASGDQGASDYYWSATCTLTVNGFTVLNTAANAGNPGRALKKFSLGSNIIDFGAVYGSDATAALIAANADATARGGEIVVPSSPYGTWFFTQSVTITAPGIRFEAGSLNTSNGATLQFLPGALTDMLPGLLINLPCIVRGAKLVGADGVPTPSQLVTGGYIITLASGQATISGTTMTLTSNWTGTIATGANTNSISGPGGAFTPVGSCQVLALLSGTAGQSGATYSLSTPQTVGTAITITQTALPNFSAFKVGSVGVQANAEVWFEECRTSGFKIGLYITSPVGHVQGTKNNFQGWVGKYCNFNNGDYAFSHDDGAGCPFAGLAYGHNGIDIRMDGDSHGGFGPCYEFQFYDGTAPTTAGTHTYVAMSFEAMGEAAIQWLPGTGTNALSILGLQTGDYFSSTYALPPSLVYPAGNYYFQLLGTLGYLKMPTGVGGNGQWPPGASGLVANIGDVLAINNGDMELDGFGVASNGGPSINVSGSSWITQRDVLMQRTERDFIRRSEWARTKSLLPTGNLLANPEVAANWSLIAGTVTISTLASLLAGALSGQVIPRNLYEELGQDPTKINVIAIKNTSGGAIVELYLNSAAVLQANQSIAYRCWGLVTSGSSLVRLNGSSTIIYNDSFFYSSAFSVAQYIGKTLTATGNTSALNVEFTTNAANTTLYLIGVMLNAGTWEPYNPNPGPTATAPLFLTSAPANPVAISSPYTATQCGEVWIVGGTVTAISRVRGGVTLPYPITQTAIKVSAGDVVTVTQTGSTLYFAQQ